MPLGPSLSYVIYSQPLLRAQLRLNHCQSQGQRTQQGTVWQQLDAGSRSTREEENRTGVKNSET